MENQVRFYQVKLKENWFIIFRVGWRSNYFSNRSKNVYIGARGPRVFLRWKWRIWIEPSIFWWLTPIWLKSKRKGRTPSIFFKLKSNQLNASGKLLQRWFEPLSNTAKEKCIKKANQHPTAHRYRQRGLNTLQSKKTFISRAITGNKRRNHSLTIIKINSKIERTINT